MFFEVVVVEIPLLTTEYCRTKIVKTVNLRKARLCERGLCMQDIKQSSFRFGSFRTVVLLSVHGICTCTLCIVRKTARMRTVRAVLPEIKGKQGGFNGALYGALII